MRPPKSLNPPGRRLWRHIEKHYDVEGLEPLVEELCHVADRLAEIRQILAREGVMAGDRRHPLVDAETRLIGQYRQLAKALGLLDDEPAPARGPGRPPAGETLR